MMSFMKRPALAGALLIAGCGSIEAPDDASETPQRAASVPGPAPSDSAAASASAEVGPQTDEKLERTAERLLSGWVGWDPTRTAFVVVTSFSQEGTGQGVIAAVVTEEVDYDGQDVLCDPGACDASSPALVTPTMSWLKKEKLESIVVFEPVVFGPGGAAVLPGGKLVWKKDHVDSVRGFKITSLPKLEVGKEFSATPAQAAQSPDGAFALVLFRMDPGENYKDGFNPHVEPRMYRTP